MTKRRVQSGGGSRTAGRTVGTEVFSPDYSHVRADLRRIAILAVSFLTVLVVLYLFLS